MGVDLGQHPDLSNLPDVVNLANVLNLPENLSVLELKMYETELQAMLTRSAVLLARVRSLLHILGR